MGDKATLRQTISEEMENRIVRGEWKAGSKLPSESQLCKDLGVSRITIRSAVQYLESRGYVRTSQGKETEIISRNPCQPFALINEYSFSRDNIIAALEFRMIFEKGIAGIAAERITEEEIKELRACYADMLATTGNVKLHATADYRFHKLLGKATKNPFIVRQQDAMEGYLQHIMENIVSLLGSAIGIHYHKLLLEAIVAHDKKTAEKTMAEHLSSTQEAISQFFADHPTVNIDR